MTTITDARKIAERHGLRGVLVLSFKGDGTFSVVTYGVSKSECRALAEVNEQIGALIKSEEIEVPEELGG